MTFFGYGEPVSNLDMKINFKNWLQSGSFYGPRLFLISQQACWKYLISILVIVDHHLHCLFLVASSSHSDFLVTYVKGLAEASFGLLRFTEAVWDELGQLHHPIVYFVPPPSLDLIVRRPSPLVA
jgi:hypothetical protein